MNTIAVVEDNLSNMKLIKSVLKNAGYHIISADNAVDGVQMIQENLPNLILMDIHMPGMDGLEATRILKADALTQHIPIIALTARAMEGDREMILASGCDAYASKPIRYKEVLALIDEIIK